MTDQILGNSQGGRSGSGILEQVANPSETVRSRPATPRPRHPSTRVSLSRVGVVGVEKIIRVCGVTERRGPAIGRRVPLPRRPRVFVDLNPEQAGVHMSRFEEVVNEAIDTVVLGEALRAEGLAAHIAERVRERQAGLRAEVRIAARYPETVPPPCPASPARSSTPSSAPPSPPSAAPAPSPASRPRA